MEYEELLKKAYGSIKVVEHNGDRFEIPRAVGEVSGSNTFISNINQIASHLRRDVGHLAKFLQKELAVPSKLEKGRLCFKGRLNSGIVNEKIEKYVKEFVICPVCRKPDTEVISERGIKFKHCIACGAKSPIKYNL